NASGFLGDRFSAVQEMLTGGELDVLTGDYLAELTMLILGRQRMKNPERGYANTFLRQMEANLGEAVQRQVKIVVNAGGLNPAGLAEQLQELAAQLGLPVAVAHVEGDDLLPRAEELGFPGALTANAYLGAFGIAECLQAGADVVVTGRVTDASLVVGPGIARFGWGPADLDALAGAVAAGHVLECGTQATGGNFAPPAVVKPDVDLRHAGFPIAELHADGSSVITKHAGTDGLVSVDTVTAQLVYEIGGARYGGPDVTTRFDTIALAQEGPDRVRISGVRGEAPPPTTKVCVNTLSGFRNEMTFALTGLDIEAKDALIRSQLEASLPTTPASLRWTLSRLDIPDAPSQVQATALLRCAVTDPDPKVVGRAFSGAVIELALASVAGFHVLAPPGDAQPVAKYAPFYVDNAHAQHIAVLPDGERRMIPALPVTHALAEVADPPLPSAPEGATRQVPLGTVFGARSGDKGGDCNVGVWAASDAGYAWLARHLTPVRVRELLPETADLEIRRTLLPNLRAVNLVLVGLLGEGVSSAYRFDPQGKAVGEWLRSRCVDLPEELLS
ncbi:MAG: acyclic terpene utilization AtuA family protein, partial [Mycobacteriaceae bacterium]